MDSDDFGLWCEEEAARYLETVRGWQVLARRVHFREGELDLVCREPDGSLVFVEVKGVRNETFGAVVERLTTQKIRRWKKAVLQWRLRHEAWDPARLLFVGVELERGQSRLVEEWVE